MTTYPPAAPSAEVTAGGGERLHVRVRGDVDYDTADGFLQGVLHHLAEHPGTRHLHLDCRELGVCDSTGLSCLLMLHRHTQAAGILLHLDNRQPPLDRLLTVTDTLVHLTGPPGPPA
ncbi:STAS domain-containing protein [Streptomyces sp. V4-01]|uniref:STAS domain-containing protein n=1 Tax=Actinacidiphila polyblastidii TaxID=3110430 RepID=A0ABU7P4Z8_9ACTN|nr:STAS domain-containing protein [Streptomyces sp. V4-01]